MKKFTIILILCCLALAACQSTGAKANGKSTVEIMKVTPSPDQAALNLALDKSTPSPNDVVVVFERSGGFAGKSEKWSVYAGGKIVKDGGDTTTVSVDQVNALLDAVVAAGFFDMKASSSISGPGNCNDCYTYQLTVTSGGQTNTISAQEGSKALPDAFWTIIQQINTLITTPVNQ